MYLIKLKYFNFRGGSLAIIDFGQIKLKSELQPSNFNLDELTQMEIEERLYDRFHIDLTDFQILFCDAGTCHILFTSFFCCKILPSAVINLFLLMFNF